MHQRRQNPSGKYSLADLFEEIALGGFERIRAISLGSARRDVASAKPFSARAFVPNPQLRARTALVLELIALRDQIVMLECSRTRRPCFGPSDQLLWI